MYFVKIDCNPRFQFIEMTKYMIDETSIGIQKISKAIIREVGELDEERENIYEITFSLKIKQAGLLDNGIANAQLRNDQDDQIVLGIREGSLQAFWTGTDGRRRIRNNQDRDSHQNRDFGPRTSVSRALSESRSQNLNQAEYVEVQVFIDSSNTQYIEIQWMFNDPEQAASHFEFEFKLGLS